MTDLPRKHQVNQAKPNLELNNRSHAWRSKWLSDKNKAWVSPGREILHDRLDSLGCAEASLIRHHSKFRVVEPGSSETDQERQFDQEP